MINYKTEIDMIKGEVTRTTASSVGYGVTETVEKMTIEEWERRKTEADNLEKMAAHQREITRRERWREFCAWFGLETRRA